VLLGRAGLKHPRCNAEACSSRLRRSSAGARGIETPALQRRSLLKQAQAIISLLEQAWYR